jgi:lysophospholipase L1-like esterase
MKIIKQCTLFLLSLLALQASALEISLEANGIHLKTDDPVGTVRLSYPMIFKEGANPHGPSSVYVTNYTANLEFANGAKAVLKIGEGGVLSLQSTALPDGAMKVSHSFTVPVGNFLGKVKWSIDGSDAKDFPDQKTAGGFISRGDALRIALSAGGSGGVAIKLPYGYQELQDQREWNTQNFKWVSYSHLPREGVYTYSITTSDGAPAALGAAKISSTEDIYVPYPAAVEELWPGRGPIRTFGWQEGIRRRYYENRIKDENSIVFVGDSLTENWRNVKDAFPEYKVANRGVGGDTSRGVLFRLPHDVVPLVPQIVFLCVGGNDLTAHGNPEHTIYNVEEMIAILNRFNSKMPIVISTVPPSSNPDAPLKPGAREAVNEGLKALPAKYKNVVVYDFSADCMDADGQQNLALFSADRLHIGPEGYKVWGRGLRKVLEKILAPTGNTPPRKIDLSKFELIWQDEFDGNELDSTKWDMPIHIRQGSSRWHPRYVSVADGELTIRVVKTDDPKYRYDSAGIRTSKGYDPENYLFSYKYGYIEARLKLPVHVRSDYWVGFWLIAGDVVPGRNDDTRIGTEIDILETFDMWNLGSMKHTLHWGGYGKKHNAGGYPSGPHLELLDGEFHTYGLYWDEERYVFFIDGKAVCETDAIGLGGTKGKDGTPLTKSQGTCRNPAYIKLSVEAAPWCGPSHLWEKNMPVEDKLVADYIRVYKGTLEK